MSISLFWFRRDLRLSDNPGLVEAARTGKVLPIYIHPSISDKHAKIGSASKLWLHHSLQALSASLGCLNIYQGNPVDIISQLVKTYKIKHVFASQRFEPWKQAIEVELKAHLTKLNVSFDLFNSSYLFNPQAIVKEDKTFYKVFSAYKRNARKREHRNPLNKPTFTVVEDKKHASTLEKLALCTGNKWEKDLISQWSVGEVAAQEKLNHFIEHGLTGYKNLRDYPGKAHTSRLSPHLHFGEISPYQVWSEILCHGPEFSNDDDIEHFFSELLWREFSMTLLFHCDAIYEKNINPKFNHYPWRTQTKKLNAWKSGLTGIPLVDAGMRELWQTGYMHNRIRMVVASFLVKNLSIHWHEGQAWFWDCLVDADLANNSASWQWVAGSGMDAAPFFRIFNPATQGEKFDKEGLYTRKYVPEIAALPDKYLFKPWEAPESVLERAGIVLGKDYPLPIVDLAASRKKALLAYDSIKGKK